MKNVCCKMRPNPAEKRIGGPRYICGLRLGHWGECGNWQFVSQPEQAEAERTHELGGEILGYRHATGKE